MMHNSSNFPDKFKSLAAALGRYKFVILTALLGLLLLLLPSNKTDTDSDTLRGASEPQQTAAELELRLEDALSRLDGAGRVEVVLTLESSGELFLAQDTETEQDLEGGKSSSETVIAGDDELPVALRYSCPVYRGALVICEGADSASVRLAVTSAVSALTGLGADKITISKMKNGG